jgi:hypothetical protein
MTERKFDFLAKICSHKSKNDTLMLTKECFIYGLLFIKISLSSLFLLTFFTFFSSLAQVGHNGEKDVE